MVLKLQIFHICRFREIPIFQFFQFYENVLTTYIEEITPTPPSLLAWSSFVSNNISVAELETKQPYANFEGAQIKRGTYKLGC